MGMKEKTNDSQNNAMGLLSSLFVGLYAWVAAVSFGAVLLDIAYSRLAPEAKLADFLLLITAVTILVALGAISLSWNSNAARNLSVASLVIVVFGLFAPVFLSPILGGLSPLGAGIRLGISGLASVLALIAFYKSRRNE